MRRKRMDEWRKADKELGNDINIVENSRIFTEPKKQCKQSKKYYPKC
jgi:hypothetical protein